MLRQIAIVSTASALVPILFLLGWVIPIRGLDNWPTWLLYVWPSGIMLMPFGGQSNPLGLEFIVVASLSVVVNAGVWCIVLIPIWRGLASRLSSRKGATSN